MGKPLSEHVRAKFKEQRDKVHFDSQVTKLITACNIMLEGDGIQRYPMKEENSQHWPEVFRHFVSTGWNVRIEGNHCWIWID